MTRWHLMALPVLAFTGGCDDQIFKGLNCKIVADAVVGISDGQLAAIDQVKETAKAEDRLTCHGRGFYSDGSEIYTRFEAVKVNDEIYYKYDIDEYKEARRQQAINEFNAESDAQDQKINQELEKIRSDLQSDYHM